MQVRQYQAVIIGGGAAGLAAAVRLDQCGISAAVIEREEYLGGILLQCIHNGFGLHEFGQELTGPEYAERFSSLVESSNIDVFCNTTAMSLESSDGKHRLDAYSATHGVIRFETQTVVLAMGCRERNRGNVGISGTRPAGVFTAGLAQRLVNIDGYMPGKDIVIVGSGDIGLIMARRMTWAGAKVHAVVEIMPYPSGITRNIVQCLHDFDIPLYLSHIVSEIKGKDRVEGVRITPLVDGVSDSTSSFEIECDTILLSVGLVPDNELSRKAGITISNDTNGAFVDSNLMTNVEGVFACGNVLHVHDLVDYVSQEARRCADAVVGHLNGNRSAAEVSVTAGANLKYILPNKVDPNQSNRLLGRPLIVKNNAKCVIRSGSKTLFEKKLRHVQPAEMIALDVDPQMLSDMTATDEIEVSLQ